MCAACVRLLLAEKRRLKNSYASLYSGELHLAMRIAVGLTCSSLAAYDLFLLPETTWSAAVQHLCQARCALFEAFFKTSISPTIHVAV